MYTPPRNLITKLFILYCVNMPPVMFERDIYIKFMKKNA